MKRLKIVAVLAITAILLSVMPAFAAADPLFVEGKTEPKMQISAWKELYVDPVNGNDSAEGSKDAPFRTIGRAKKEVRKINVNMQGDIVVNLRGGEYFPEITTEEIPLDNQISSEVYTYPLRVSDLTFTPQDSGKGGHQVIYRAYENEKPVIMGSKKVDGWKLYDGEKNIYRAFVGKDNPTRHFIVDDTCAVRARSEGGFPKGTTYNWESHANGAPAFVVPSAEMESWKRIENVELVFQSLFTFSRLCIDRVEKNGDNLNVYMKQPGYYYITHKGGTSPTLPTWIENAYELLDQPGEWYCNKEDGYLYYKPLEGQNVDTMNAQVPYMDVALRFTGESKEKRVENIRFSGIEVKNTDWLRPSYNNGHNDAQNNYIREGAINTPNAGDCDFLSDAAVELSYAEGIILDRCIFRNIGMTVITLRDASRNNYIYGNGFYNLSAGGIMMGDPQWRDESAKKNFQQGDPQELMFNNDIVSNYFHKIAREFRSATAISSSYMVDMDVTNNEIHDVPYSGMHFGYGWAEVKNVYSRDNRIQKNIVDVFMNGMFDGGGIYVIGATGGTKEHPNIISDNFIRNQCETNFGGLYFDEGSTNWVVYNNVFENTPMWCHVSVISKALRDVNITESSITDGYAYLNYTLGQSNMYVENPNVYENHIFPEQVQKTVDGAGLLPEFVHLRANYDALEEVRFAKSNVELKSGESVSSGAVLRDARGRIVTEVKPSFTSSNENVARVDNDGTVTAVAKGQCEIKARATKNSKTVEAVMTVSVDNSVKGISVVSNDMKLKPGMQTTVSAQGFTEFGKNFGVNILEYKSDAPSVLSVDDRGIATANADGTANVIVKAEKDGVQFENKTTILVQSNPTGDFIEDGIFWKVNRDAKVNSLENGFVFNSVKHGTCFAAYAGQKYLNEVFDFNVNIQTSTNDWPSFALRMQNPDTRVIDAGNAGYLITVKYNVIELQRFNNGTRTVLYGDLAGFVSKGGSAILNNVLPYGETKAVSLSAVNENGGVRLKMIVEGKEVFNFLDTDSAAVTQEGYFGMICNQGSVTVTK